MAQSENILMFFHAPNPGEQRSSISRTLQELQSAGYTVHTLAAPHAWLAEEEDAKLVRHEIWIPGKRSSGWIFWLYFSFAAFSTLLVLALAQHSRAIVTFRPTLSLLAKPASLATWTPIILFLDTVPRVFRPETNMSLFGGMLRRLRETLGLLSAKRIVPSTNAAARAVYTVLPILRRRIRPLSYAASLPQAEKEEHAPKVEQGKWLAGAAAAKKALRERWDLSEKSFVIGVYDKLEDHRSIECVMRAVVAAEESGLEVVIFSTGPARRLVDSIALSLGLTEATSYAGDVSESIAEAAACDLFLFAPSFYTAHAWVTDLLSTGVPILGPDNPIIREVLGSDELLYTPFHVEALAARLRRLSSQPEELQEIAKLCKAQASSFAFNRAAALTEILRLSA